MIHQIWRITEKKRDGVTTRLEAEALYWFRQVDSCDKELLDTWGFFYVIRVRRPCIKEWDIIHACPDSSSGNPVCNRC